MMRRYPCSQKASNCGNIGRSSISVCHLCRPMLFDRSRKFLHQASDNQSSSKSEDEHNVGMDWDLNELHTQLYQAVSSEDYSRAAAIRDIMRIKLEKGGENVLALGDWEKLGIVSWLAQRASELGFMIPTPIQSRSATVIANQCDCIINAPTGSGKTLAFLLPLLSLLEYPPEVYPDDLDGPRLLLVVPTRELGVQIAMLVFKLFGGSVNPGIPGSSGNMFRYVGPRGIKVKGLLLEDEVESAVTNRYLFGAHVVVGTPHLIASALERGVEVTQHVQAVVVDEADACYHECGADLKLILDTAVQRQKMSSLSSDIEGDEQTSRPVVVLSGATVSDDLVETAIRLHWLKDPVDIVVGNRGGIPSSICHQYVVVDHVTDKIGTLCRCILRDERSQNLDSQPSRAIVFVDDADIARRLADPLRNVLWGKHSISVLLPDGLEPIKALHAFRDNEATLLIATPPAARGLDLPAVTHVYNLSLPASETDYVHRAGRMGRIGASGNGVITTIVQPEEEEGFLTMCKDIGCAEHARRIESPPPPQLHDLSDGSGERDMEHMKRALEAILALSSEENNPDPGTL